MGFNVDKSQLSSMQSFNNRGTLSINTALQAASTNNEGGIIGWIWQGLAGAANFLFSKIGGFLSWSASQVWGFIVASAQFIYSFNWNQTDAQINASINAQWEVIASQLGGTLGNAAGYIACGFIPAAGIFVFNEALGAYILSKVTEEFAEEFLANLAVLSTSILNATAQTAFKHIYMNARKFIKDNIKTIRQIFPGISEAAINNWGSEKSKPWSFALAVNNWVERINPQWVQNLVEEFIEEFQDGCREAGYVVAEAITSFYAKSLIQQKLIPAAGENLTVEIQLDREDDLADKIYLQAPESVLRGQINNVLATNQLIGDKSFGTVYGVLPFEALKERRFKPQLHLIFKGKSNDGSSKILESEITLRITNKGDSDFQNYVYIDQLAALIKQKFATPPFVINRGNKPFTYNDGALITQLWVTDATEAKRVIERILDLVGQNPNWKKLKPMSSVDGAELSLIPEKVPVLGVLEKLPVKGYPGTVAFREAFLLLYGSSQPVSLVDLTGKRTPRVSVT